jgi:hypothetical protein
MSRPEFRQAPTLQQIVGVYRMVRFGRAVVSKGNTFTPEEAVTFRELMHRLVVDFELPDNWNDTPAQAAVRVEMEARDA